MRPIAMRDEVLILLYVLALGLSSLHLYRKPVYAMDSIQYMANALLMEDTDIVRVHRRVYAELNRAIPESARQGLLGHDPAAPADQNKSRQERARSAETLGEFLPFFAIRPLYNQCLWLVSKTGFGLIRSAILISVGSYFAIGMLLFLWIRRYAGTGYGAAIAFLLMLSPPLTELGRELTSDALATAVAFAALFLIFEKGRIAPGLALLLASIFFRTDFVVLAAPVLLLCWIERRVDIWKTTVLAALALGSALAINHFAGDYGIKMLYYRNFVGVPISPAEMNVQFTFGDYLSAFRSGATLASYSFFLPFLLLGVLGLAATRMRSLFYVSLAYVVLHFIILPNWQERWVALFYLCCGVCAAAGIQQIPVTDHSEAA